MTDILDQLQPSPKRDRYGRYLIPHPETGKEVAWTRATTVASTLADKFGLNAWSQRMTAIGLTRRADLYARVAACPVEDKDTLNRLVDEAKEAAAASAGANIGTALHSFTERLDRGEDITVPAPWDADVVCYRKTLDDAGVQILDVECTVTILEHMVAGTFDRTATLPRRPLPLITDLKTGGFLDWTEIAIQLALYAHADTIYDHAAGTHRPMPEVDQERALVIHLPAGKATCTLYLVDIEAGWVATKRAMWVRGWRKRRDLVEAFKIVEGAPSPELPAVVEPPTVPVVSAGERRAWLLVRIETLRTNHTAALADLARRWPHEVPTFKQSETHTDEQLDVIAALLSAIEADHGVPFSPPDPATAPPAPMELGPAPERPDNVVDLFADTPPARPTGVLAIKDRLDALPADLRASVEATAIAQGVPNLLSPTATAAHVALVEAELIIAERTHEERKARVASLLVGLDEEVVTALLVAAGGGVALERLEEPDVDRLELLAGAVETAVLGLGFAEDGRPVLVATPQAEVALMRAFGTKTGVLAAAKATAETLGMAKPRTVSAAIADPLLVALTLPRASAAV